MYYFGIKWDFLEQAVNYRAPEIQIHNSLRSNYSSPVDMWSAGKMLYILTVLMLIYFLFRMRPR